MKKTYWYRVNVKCVSYETFSVEASSEKEARARYNAGQAVIEHDEVYSRKLLKVQKGQAI